MKAKLVETDPMDLQDIYKEVRTCVKILSSPLTVSRFLFSSAKGRMVRVATTARASRVQLSPGSQSSTIPWNLPFDLGSSPTEAWNTT